MIVQVLGLEVEIDETVIDAPTTEINRQVEAYLAGERREFDLSIRYPEGFTGEVMRAIASIPFGETRTYGQLAEQVGSAPRAVGGGCGRNPIPIVVPCHRVVRSDGGLGGFSAGGDRGLDLKRALLEFEAGVAHSSEDSPSSTLRRIST
jgi:methylated-DNA-[protein]-cysteine S-methyltransferase